MTPTKLHIAKQQSGAALIIALILLVALTLMAISSVNTASLDLIMAGNEQYRSRAFTAAEAGIENALRTGTFNSQTNFSASASTGTGQDGYTYKITSPNSGVVEAAPTGYSSGGGQFGAVYFRIESEGVSERGTRATVTQELFQVVNTADGPGFNSACGNASLDDTASTC